MKRVILFCLIIICLVISGCVEYPEALEDPQYSAPIWYDLECGNRCVERCGNCLSNCNGLPEYEFAVCCMECYNNRDNCIESCSSQPKSVIYYPS